MLFIPLQKSILIEAKTPFSIPARLLWFRCFFFFEHRCEYSQIVGYHFIVCHCFRLFDISWKQKKIVFCYPCAILNGFLSVHFIYVCCLQISKLIFIDNNGRLNANSYDTLIQLIVVDFLNTFIGHLIEWNAICTAKRENKIDR